MLKVEFLRYHDIVFGGIDKGIHSSELLCSYALEARIYILSSHKDLEFRVGFDRKSYMCAMHVCQRSKKQTKMSESDSKPLNLNTL